MKHNSIKIIIWKFFLLFSCLILILLWLFQILFLPKYYELSKKKDIKEVSEIILKNKNKNNLENTINNLSYKNEMCIEVIDKNYYTLFSSSFSNKGCLISSHNGYYKRDFINSNNKNKYYKIKNKDFNNTTLIYAFKLNNNYIFINTSIDPIDRTITILRKQLIIISIIILILSFILSYFISNHLSKPLTDITNDSKKLGEGKYNVTFKKYKIKELNELSNTLNKTENKLANIDKLQKDLIANTSHDLKTPLTMIKAYAEMAKDLHKNTNKIDNDMNIIIDESDRLTQLVNDILELSKSQNIDKLKLETFDIIDLIQTTLNKYNYLIEQENYIFKFIHKNKQINVIADKEKINRVIYNLITNSINNSQDKTIIIKITKKDTILIEIINKGNINEKELEHIWDKYYSNSQNHKRNTNNTGLGLTIVKNILEKHKFNYGIKNEKDKTISWFEIK